MDERGEETPAELKTILQYIIELHDCLQTVNELVSANLKQAWLWQAHHYNKKTRAQKLKVDDSTLLLLPMNNNKFQVSWQGPSTIIATPSQLNYTLRFMAKKKLTTLTCFISMKKVETKMPDTLIVAVAATDGGIDDQTWRNIFFSLCFFF